MRGKRTSLWAIAVVSLVGAHSTAYANMGIPLIYHAWPVIGAMLLPVIILEAFVLMRVLRAPLKRTVLVSTVGNVVTTIIGIIVTIAVLLVIYSKPFGWLDFWMLHVVKILSLVPCFVISWLVEYVVARRMMRDMGPSAVKSAVLRANLASYASLVFIMLGTWIFVD